MKKRKNVPVGVRQSRNKFFMINGTSKQRKTAISFLKESLSYQELCNSIDHSEKTITKSRQDIFWGNPLPNSYKVLGCINDKPYFGSKWLSELNHCLINVRKFKYEINLFLNYKEQFENQLILGNYKVAEEILTKIENEVCFSIWTLENRFVLKELAGKASENKEFLGYFNEINESEGKTKSLAHYLSLRAEHALSVNKYFSDLEIALGNIRNSKNKSAFVDYYRFKLTFINHINYQEYGAILHLDFENSIIDRYLNLIKVFTNLFTMSNFLDTDQERKEDIKPYLKSRINYLIKKVNDPVLKKLKLFFNEYTFSDINFQQCQQELKVIDNYTVGLYSEAEKTLVVLLQERPTQFDLYLLYVKCLIYQNKSFIPIGNSRSVQNQILSAVFDITNVKVDPHQAGLNLLRIANNLASSTLSYGITDFVYFQTKGKKERNLLAKISFSSANPALYQIYNTIEEQKHFLGLLSNKFSSSITVDFFKAKLEGTDTLHKFQSSIPEGKFKLELAKLLHLQCKYDQSLPEWEYLTLNFKNTPPIYEAAIGNLFDCYFRLNRYNDCIKLFVDSYFENPFLIEKIETKDLVLKINTNRFKNVDRTIELPIFYTIVDADEIEKHITFELFNRANAVEKPSELLMSAPQLDRKKFMYFLEYVCSPKVLMHSTFIQNSKERLEERLTIANYIRVNSDKESALIESEIKSIQNILVIQQGLIDLDESKIYVNEQGIIDSELHEFKAIYDRFQIIVGITNKHKYLILEGGKLTTFFSEDTEFEKIEYSNNPVFDIYTELFEAVKNKFLNSQFGIVAYLSTRIRHGVLVGELRPVFETHKLITLKEGASSNYRRNYYWDAIYNDYPLGHKDAIQSILESFSAKVDGMIFDLIKKYLQVYNVDSNEDGWFNYDFGASELWIHSVASINSKDFNSFVHQIFEVLWLRTDQNLEKIREKIEKDILSQFNTFFADLEKDIIQRFGSTSNQELIKSIKDCSTEVQTVMHKISRWFKRSEIKASDFYLSNLIDIISEYTNKSSLYKNLRLDKNISYDCLVKGDFKTHFADLLRIFLENIIKHSEENAQSLSCQIATYNIDDSLVIEIENSITNENSIESLSNVWKGPNMLDVKKLLNEGKSGYHKAFKILTSDLKCSEKDCLKTSISEDKDNFKVTLTININNIKS